VSKPNPDEANRLALIEAMLRRGDSDRAVEAARSAISRHPGHMQAHVLLGHAQRQRGDTDAGLASARLAMQLAPRHPAPRMLLVDLLHESGQTATCLRELKALSDDSRSDGSPTALLHDLAQRFTMLGLHSAAEQCHARAVQRHPDHAGCLYNHATALIALGRIDEAETTLDRAIALSPTDSDAWYNRATLRRQTPEHNHVAAIRARLALPGTAASSQVALGYALAKELEDLGDDARSFEALASAATTRRQSLRYKVEGDLETMQLIEATFDADYFSSLQSGDPDERPLFIVGLPRSGTTLVDRILSSHADIVSRGETSDLAMAIVRAAGPARSKPELVRKSASLDPKALGARYCAHLPDDPAKRQIDKTPVNFLYLGLIAAALPNARIIHLRRNPMDACYAMYKTLFRMAYPFSYDLSDLGRYWVGYDRLMAHWRKVLPAGRLLEVDYEGLVADQETVSRRLVDFAGLPWQPQCLSFERNTSPSLTASAAQVRQPLYSSSVGLWQRYAHELAPLRHQLIAAGIPVPGALPGSEP